jgi:hypothetical protein
VNTDRVEKIANAVMYEGYILYPYRPSSVKNRQRFNFGVLYPADYGEASSMRTECLVQGNASTTIDVKVRFLQLAERETWQEGHEREVCVIGFRLSAIQPLQQAFAFLAMEDEKGRRQKTIAGEVELISLKLDDELFKITVSVRNCRSAHDISRDEALLRSLVSVHSILQVTNGGFVSLLDPPAQIMAEAASCKNEGTWPVLVGEEGQTDMMLSAPIILYDYPKVAPESPGDLFDGTEIDEILALRILTMTDAEKLEVRNSDARARKILERTEMMPPEYFQKLHGVLRK